MKYILLMQFPLSDWKTSRMELWPKQDAKRHMDFLHGLNKELVDRGEFVGAEGLAGPENARVVQATGGGAPAITDGPFPESKEFLAGYWIVDVATPERAYEIAGRASAGPGPGGLPLNMPIEVRPVLGGPHRGD